MGETVIINKVAESGLLEIDLENFYPREEIIVFDLKDYLFMELILKEKDFREALKKLDVEVYRGKYGGCNLYGRCDYSRLGLYAGGQLPSASCKGNPAWRCRSY